MSTDRYNAIPAQCGWMVVDTRTGKPVEIGAQRQVDLSELSAATTARLLNNLAAVGQGRTDRLAEVLVSRPPAKAGSLRSTSSGPLKF